mgnify:CR=1 FL=1
MNLSAADFTMLWVLGNHAELDVILDAHRVAKDDPEAASLVELGNGLLLDLLLDHDVAPDSNVGQLMSNYISYEVGKYERGDCFRIEKIRALVHANPDLRTEM